MKKITLFPAAVFIFLGSGMLFAVPEMPAPAALEALKHSGGSEEARLSSLLQRSLEVYESVRDYEAIFYKQEKGKDAPLGPEEKIFLKFEKPFKIYMGWLNTYKKGLQVVYERGRHRGRLAIHKPGFGLGLVPVIFLDPNSPWVREGSEPYNIEDAGIGTFLRDFTEAVLKGKRENKLKVYYESAENDGGIGVTFDGSREGEGYFAHTVLVTFDAKTSLPTRMSLFDWQNKSIGVYAYEKIQLNVGADDQEFLRQINRQLYKVYKG